MSGVDLRGAAVSLAPTNCQEIQIAEI